MAWMLIYGCSRHYYVVFGVVSYFLSLSTVLRGDLSECHVTGAQKYNHLCFSVARLIKKDGRMSYLWNKTKMKRFWMVRQRETDAWSLWFLLIFPQIWREFQTPCSDNWTFTEQNLVSGLCFSAVRPQLKCSSVRRLWKKAKTKRIWEERHKDFRFEPFLSKIRDMEENCLLTGGGAGRGPNVLI